MISAVIATRNVPATTYATMNADILEHFDPDFRRSSMMDRISAPWPT